MRGFAYTAMAAAIALQDEPDGWPYDGWTWPGPPWPPGHGAPATAGTTWAQTYNLVSTSGTLALVFITPWGNFTLSTAEADSGSIKTATKGGLTFTYSGSSYGSRGTLSITGTGSVGGGGGALGGAFYLLRTHTGNITITGTVTVIAPGIVYTSSGESYTAQTLAAATVIKPLRPQASGTMTAAGTINSPVYMRAV